MKRLFFASLFILICSVNCLAQLPVRLTEEAFDLNTPTGKIKGSLILPQTTKPCPVVLIIAGSGLTDRDGNTFQSGMKNNSLKYLAEGLSPCGIASLRYDKRGIAASAGAGKAESEMRFDDYVQDVRKWIDLLSQDSRFSSVYVLGHSEGSLIGMLAVVDNRKVKGFISLAGAGRPAYELLEEQVADQPEIIRKEVTSINQSLKAGQPVKNVSAGLMPLFRPSVQPYMISWYKYNPAVVIAKLKMPILILQGTKDIQISVKDAELLKKAAPSAQLHLIESMNHVLKNCQSKDKKQQMDTYTNPSFPINKELISYLEKMCLNK